MCDEELIAAAARRALALERTVYGADRARRIRAAAAAAVAAAAHGTAADADGAGHEDGAAALEGAAEQAGPPVTRGERGRRRRHCPRGRRSAQERAGRGALALRTRRTIL